MAAILRKKHILNFCAADYVDVWQTLPVQCATSLD